MSYIGAKRKTSLSAYNFKEGRMNYPQQSYNPYQMGSLSPYMSRQSQYPTNDYFDKHPDDKELDFSI